jgi:hypothetical protein
MDLLFRIDRVHGCRARAWEKKYTTGARIDVSLCEAQNWPSWLGRSLFRGLPFARDITLAKKLLSIALGGHQFYYSPNKLGSVWGGSEVSELMLSTVSTKVRRFRFLLHREEDISPRLDVRDHYFHGGGGRAWSSGS